jgi:hypothetical protein
MKLNKSEAVEAAKNMARNNQEANAYTVAQLEAMSWDERRKQAAILTLTSMVTTRVDTHRTYRPAVHEAFENGILAIWSAKLKSLENGRRNFKRACSGLTTEQARQKIVDLVTSMNIRGARVHESGFDVNRVPGGHWGGPGINWSLDLDYDAAIVNPDDDRQRVYRYKLALKFSTSGSTYSPAQMGLLHKIHAELIDAANEILVVMADVNIISKFGFPELVVEPVVESTNTEVVNLDTHEGRVEALTNL